jgi:hypothetical protein
VALYTDVLTVELRCLVAEVNDLFEQITHLLAGQTSPLYPGVLQFIPVPTPSHDHGQLCVANNYNHHQSQRNNTAEEKPIV